MSQKFHWLLLPSLHLLLFPLGLSHSLDEGLSWRPLLWLRLPLGHILYMAVCVGVAFQTHILWRRYRSLVVSTHVQASCTHVVQYKMLTSSFQAICSKPVKSCAIADCRIFSLPLQLDLSGFYYINFLRLKRWKEVLEQRPLKTSVSEL